MSEHGLPPGSGRVATGCLAMSGIDHLHQETKVLPLRIHSNMITKQLMASFFLPAHPGYKHLRQDKAARNLKKTILENEEEVAELYSRGITCKEVIKTLHTSTVQSSINNYAPNRVLQAPPPDINPEEKELDRTSRTRLARLRSGFCRTLQSYMSRIDDQEVDSCPNCEESPHDTQHIFNCKENPTDLTPMDMWTRPKLVARFLFPQEDG